jgi:hypothetical protein
MKEYQEMKSEDFWERTGEIMHEYSRAAESELTERWKNWKLDLTYREMYEVIGALLARQVTQFRRMQQTPRRGRRRGLGEQHAEVASKIPPNRKPPQIHSFSQRQAFADLLFLPGIRSVRQPVTPGWF